jgi:fatty acid desaturase
LEHRTERCWACSYRDIHLEHHKYFGENGVDPDYTSYAVFPRTRGEFLLRFVKNATGVGTVLQFLTQKPKKTKANPNVERALLVGTQLVVAALLTWTVGWFAYPLLWLTPLVTVGKLCSSTRAFCEHAAPTGPPVIRTITGNFFQTITFGSFAFNYHAEHHYRPWIPYVNLPRARPLLAGDLVDQAEFVQFRGGYFALLFRWYRSLPRRLAGGLSALSREDF